MFGTSVANLNTPQRTDFFSHWRCFSSIPFSDSLSPVSCSIISLSFSLSNFYALFSSDVFNKKMLQMILYLVCFDLARPLEEQIQQISYWLDFLHSSLPLPPPPVLPNSNWGILLVGLRADMQDPYSSKIQLADILTWQRMYPRLSILNQKVFAVSAFTSEESVSQLLHTVDLVCDNIFSQHAVEIPSTFRSTLQNIQNNPPPSDLSLVAEDVLYAEHGTAMDREVFSTLIQYFHEIGHIVRLQGGLVCTDPQSIPKLAAQFVSPESVRIALLKERVQILTEQDIGYILKVDNTSPRYLLDHFSSI